MNFCNLMNPQPHKKASSYLCSRRVVRTMSTALLVLVLLISGFFYMKIILALRKGSKNSHKRFLTVAFILLWAFWFLQTAPFAVYDFIVMWSLDHSDDIIGTGAMGLFSAMKY